MAVDGQTRTRIQNREHTKVRVHTELDAYESAGKLVIKRDRELNSREHESWSMSNQE